MKTNKQKLEQVKRIMKALRLRGQNKESINELYKKLLNEKSNMEFIRQ